MKYQDFLSELARIRAQENKSFAERNEERQAYIDYFADRAGELGYGAKAILGTEHTQVGRYHGVQYSKEFIPVNPNGVTIGCEVFGSVGLAIASGFFKERDEAKELRAMEQMEQNIDNLINE